MKYKIMSHPFETKADELNIAIPLKTAEKLNLINISNTTLQFGARSLNVSITISSEPDLTDEVLWLSENALKELLIPDNIEICVQIIDHGNIIKLGPIVGILTDRFILEDHKKGRPIREAFNCYAEAGNQIGGFIYIFSLNKIDLDNKRIMGYIPLMNKSMITEWQEQWLPLPDAIHNRIKISPSSSLYKKIDEISKLVPAINIINRTTQVYKWRIQKILEKDLNAKKYLPKTLLFKGVNTLTKMLQEFPFIYLKPVGRSLGLGIIKITKDGPEEYTAKYRRRGNLYSLNGTLADILPKLSTLMGKRAYIVQEGIPLATYNGNIFDLRVTVQKDETGTWGLSRWKARVAAQNSIVTNISAGGTGAHINQITDSVFKEEGPEILNNIKTACLSICSAIENKISGIGDIGLDIGVTEGGKIYIIEANFRELRLNGGSAEDLESWKDTFKKPIYYLNYLYKIQLQNNKP
jgi:glutathione synthase/RimK-type ligase-like ATP-grasp enzyme/translation elongation factor EF-1beta